MGSPDTPGLGLVTVLLLGGYAATQVLSGLRQARRDRLARGALPPEAPTRLEHTAVAATLEVRHLADAGLDAPAAAREWNGVVVADRAERVELLFLPEARLVGLLLDVLALHHAEDVRVLHGPLELGPAASPLGRCL